MAQLQAQPSINDARTQAHLALGARLAQIDLTPLLVYRVDSVPASALPALAWQFDVLSPLWQLLAPASGSAAQSATQAARDLIKLAISLHRVRGTPYAIKTALNALGWPGVTILEGQSSWGGNSYPSNQGWAVFRVQILIADTQYDLTKLPTWDPTVSYAPGNVVSLLISGFLFYYMATGTPAVGIPPQYTSIDAVQNVDAVVNWDTLLTQGWMMLGPTPKYRPPTAADANTIIAAVNFFKPARSWLDSVWFIEPPLTDALTISDAIGAGDSLRITDSTAVVMSPVTDPMTFVPDYSGRWQHAGDTYADQPIGIVDGAVVVNGTPKEGNQ